MLNWAAITAVIKTFLARHGPTIFTTSALGAAAFGPVGASLGVVGTGVSILLEQPWFSALLQGIIFATPSLQRLFQERDQPNTTESEQGMSPIEFIRLLAAKVAEILRGMNLLPQSVSPAITYSPHRHDPTTEA